MNSTDPEPLTSALATQDKLRDMRAHLDTMTPQLVHSADGRIMMAAASMPEGMALEEDYPLTTPKLKLPPIGEDPTFINQYNGAVLRDIESHFDGYGLNTMEGADGNNLLGRCCTVAMIGEYLQVIWSGARRQWVVERGEAKTTPHTDGDADFRVVTHSIPRTYLNGISGWILLPITFKPRARNSGDAYFSITSFGPPKIFADPKQSTPPKVSAVQTTPGGTDYNATITWSEGTFYLPLARVIKPGDGRVSPSIAVCHVGGIDFSPFYLGSFPSFTKYFIL